MQLPVLQVSPLSDRQLLDLLDTTGPRALVTHATLLGHALVRKEIWRHPAVRASRALLDAAGPGQLGMLRAVEELRARRERQLLEALVADYRSLKASDLEGPFRWATDSAIAATCMTRPFNYESLVRIFVDAEALAASLTFLARHARGMMMLAEIRAAEDDTWD